MRFIRYFLFDLEQGIFRNKALLFAPVIVAVIAFLDFINKANRLLNSPIVSLGDFLFYLYGGMHKYTPSPGNAFRFPIVWMVVFVLIPCILLNYPLSDIYGMGKQILVRSESRRVWWISKCCWNILSTLIYHVILQATGLLLAFIFGIEISNQIHINFIRMVFEVGHQEIWNRYFLPFSIVMMPVCVSIVLNMFQMMLCLFLKPIFSFFLVVIVLLGSAYMMTPFLLGNYAMVYRYNWMLKEGLSLDTGRTLLLMIYLCSVVVGNVRFKYYDILEKE